MEWKERLGRHRRRSPKAVNASEEFLGRRDDDARRASHVAESVLVLVLGHLADEFGAVGAQASDSVVRGAHQDRERDAVGVNHKMALRALFAAIRCVLARFLTPPPRAGASGVAVAPRPPATGAAWARSSARPQAGARPAGAACFSPTAARPS